MAPVLFLSLLAACRRDPPKIGETGVPTSACVPSAEVCNALDDDCDGEVDEDATDAGSGYLDADGDGYGGEAVTACGVLAAEGGDCDDADPAVNPDATEAADGRDEDCDGRVDDGTSAADDDGDGWSEDDGDCDDLDVGVHPEEMETANDRDDDCDGEIDEGTADADADGWTEAAGDCDDFDPAAHPGADELCGDADLDCDGADPLGTAQFVGTDGTRTDLSASLAGSSSALAEVALTGDGTLYICPGTWYPALSITGSVTIEGRGEPVLSGSGRGVPVTSTGTTLAVTGVTFEDGDGVAGGCLSHVGDTLTLDTVTFSGCTADTAGGAVWAETRSVSVNASTFEDNEVRDGEPGGGGMWVEGDTVDMVDTTFSGNRTRPGTTYTHAGGLYFEGSTLTLTGCTFSANEVDAPADYLAFGGGLSTSADVVVESSTFTDNDVASGGAGALNVASLTMRDSTISDNHAGGFTGFGGAVVGNDLVFEDSTIDSNEAYYMGGAVFTTSTLTFTRCEITDNIAYATGGAVYNTGSTVLTDSVSIGNSDWVQGYYSTGSCSNTQTDDQGGAPGAVSLAGCATSMSF